mmetsp:Transcript_32224/g.95878  ORF Transcript_32224/g.95878 Transcript_32224/m.95878 type:complete len:212 (-) Transcript_32224:173-808(-)
MGATKPVPSSFESASVTAASVCGSCCCCPASTATRYGLAGSAGSSDSTTEQRSATWMVGSRLEASPSVSSGSASPLHARLKSGWSTPSPPPYVRPAATTCVRSAPSRWLFVTSFSSASSSLKLTCGRRRLYSASVSGSSGALSSIVVRVQVITDETPTSTFGSGMRSAGGIAASCISASSSALRQSRTVMSASRKAASSPSGVGSTVLATQ